MMRTRLPLTSRRWPVLVGLLLLALGSPTLAQDSPSAAGDDPIFDRYVNLDLLASAWEDKNVDMLTDIGLEMAEGERVLMRAHKGITSDQVFAAALKVAAEQRDKAGLARLTKVLVALKRDDLVAEAKRAKQLADAGRAALDPALVVAVDATSVEAFMLLKDTLEAIGSAKVGQNAKGLEAIVKEIPQMAELTEAQRRALLKMTREAQALLPKDAKEADPIADTLNKLASESRGPRGGGGRPSGGGGGRPSGGGGRPSGGGAGRPGGGGGAGRGSRANAPRTRTTRGAHWQSRFSSRHNCYVYWDGDFGCWYIYDSGCSCYAIVDDPD